MVHDHQRISEGNHFLLMFFQVYVRPDFILVFSLFHNPFHITNIFVVTGTNKMYQKWQNIIQFCVKLSHCYRNIVTCMFWVRKKVTHEMVKVCGPLGIITSRNGQCGINKVDKN